jgi:hypothetical protein
MMLDARWDDPTRLRSYSMPCMPERQTEAQAESVCPSSPLYLPSNLGSVKLDPSLFLHRRPRQSSFDSVFPAASPTRINDAARRTDQSPTKPRRRLEPAAEDVEAGRSSAQIRQAKMRIPGLEKLI